MRKIILLLMIGTLLSYAAYAFDHDLKLVMNETAADTVFQELQNPNTYGNSTVLWIGEDGEAYFRTIFNYTNKICDSIGVQQVQTVHLQFYCDASNRVTCADLDNSGVKGFPYKTDWHEFTPEAGVGNVTDVNYSYSLLFNQSPINIANDNYFNWTLNASYVNDVCAGNEVYHKGILIRAEDLEDNPDNDYIGLSSVEDAEKPVLWIQYTTSPPDTTAPTINSTSINDSSIVINEVVSVSVLVSDETQLSSVHCANNITGTLTNISSINFSNSETSANYSCNFTNTLPRNAVINTVFTVNDSSGNYNQSDVTLYTVQNSAPSTPTIVYPTTALRTNVHPVDVNVTSASDPDSDTITYYFYINDTLNQTSTTNISVNMSSGTYSINVSAYDGTAFSSNISVILELDLTEPFMTVSTPTSATYDDNITVNITCTDDNVFLLNYTFYNASLSIIESWQNSTPIGNELSIFRTLLITNLTDGNYTFNVSCSDSHTLNAIDPYDVDKDMENLKLTFNDNIEITMLNEYPITDITTEKLDDRYIFEFTKETPKREMHTFFVKSDYKIKYMKDSNYDAHFVIWGSKNWVDFENNDKNAEYTVRKISDYEYQVDILTDDLRFNSVGGLNVVEQQIDIVIDYPDPPAALTGNTLEGFDYTNFTEFMVTVIIMVVLGGVMINGIKKWRLIK